MKQELDREEDPHPKITVVCMDGGGLSTSSDVIIDVGDVNDVTPQFEKDHYHFNISSKSSIGFRSKTMQAKDLDSSSQRSLFKAQILEGDSGERFDLFFEKFAPSADSGFDFAIGIEVGMMSSSDYVINARLF